jgi:hypothetical protein
MMPDFGAPSGKHAGRTWVVILTWLAPVPILAYVGIHFLDDFHLTFAFVGMESVYLIGLLAGLLTLWNGKTAGKGIISVVIAMHLWAFWKYVSPEWELEILVPVVPLVGIWAFCLWILHLNHKVDAWLFDKQAPHNRI